MDLHWDTPSGSMTIFAGRLHNFCSGQHKLRRDRDDLYISAVSVFVGQMVLLKDRPACPTARPHVTSKQCVGWTVAVLIDHSTCTGSGHLTKPNILQTKQYRIILANTMIPKEEVRGKVKLN